jgi:hypothetical protein
MSMRARSMAVLLLLAGCRPGWHDDEPIGPGGRGRGHPEPHPGHGGVCPGGPGGERRPDGGPGWTGTTSDGGVIGVSGGPGGGTGGTGGTGGSTAPGRAGYCTGDAGCGSGLVCDRTLGACAQPRGGCGMAAFQPTRTTGEIVLVLDRSNSMRDSTTTGTKWSDLTGSIDSVLTRRGEVAWGLTLFPASDAQACVTGPLSIAPAVGTAGAISSGIRAATPTGSGTPTRGAVLQAGREILGSGRPTRKYLLLATDGEPNCTPGEGDPAAADVAGTTSAIRSLAEQGLTTFVLGVAVHGASADALTSMAGAGGHARQAATAYYTASDAPALEGALDEVARQVALCTFELTPPPPAGTTLTLSIGGRAFARNPGHVGDGWDVTGAGKAIELYGAACDAIQAGGAVTLGYGCGSGTQCDGTAMACVPVGLP